MKPKQNELIETTKMIRERKAEKEIQKNPKRIRMIQGECDDLNNEMEELKQNYDHGRYEKTRKFDVREHLSELVGMEIKQKLFDSNI